MSLGGCKTQLMHPPVPTRRLGVLAWWLSCLMLLTVPSPALAGVSATGVDGVEVSLDAPAERIVSLAPHVSELLFTAGAGERLVGAVEHSDYPPAAGKVPRVGDAFRIDLERISDLEPDLVVAWQSGNPADAVTSLRELGIPVLVTEVHELDDIPGLLTTLGKLAGSTGPAESAAASFRGNIAELRREYSGREPVRVFYQATAQPLYTVGGSHVITQAIELCGGRNVFAAENALAPSVGEEAVIAVSPEAIVAGAQASEPDPLERWRRWDSIPAVAAGHLYRLDADRLNRSTTRLAEGAEELCRVLDRAREE